MLFIKFFLLFSVFIMHQTLESQENNTQYFEYKLNELIVKKNKSKQEIDTIIEAIEQKNISENIKIIINTIKAEMKENSPNFKKLLFITHPDKYPNNLLFTGIKTYQETIQEITDCKNLQVKSPEILEFKIFLERTPFKYSEIFHDIMSSSFAQLLIPQTM